jgi:hypothetical protein
MARRLSAPGPGHRLDDQQPAAGWQRVANPRQQRSGGRIVMIVEHANQTDQVIAARQWIVTKAARMNGRAVGEPRQSALCPSCYGR